MVDDPRPTNGNGDIRFTWRDWALQREHVTRQIEGAVAGADERRLDAVSGVGKRVDDHGTLISGLQQALLAVPDGEKPGGLLWQLGEIRDEQKSGRRNIIVILGAISFLFNIAAPYVQKAIDALLSLPAR